MASGLSYKRASDPIVVESKSVLSISMAPKRPKKPKLMTRAKSMSDMKEARQRYDVRGRKESNRSIHELGIGADIDRPDELRYKRDTTHKTRDFRENVK